MVNVATFNIPKSNNDFAAIRISTAGVTCEKEDFHAIPNLTNISAKTNMETKENFYYGDAGKSTRKTSKAPSVEIKFTYSDAAIHGYLLQTAWADGKDGMTQVEIDTVDGYTVSFICNVVGDNFGPDGAPEDDAEYTMTLSYATGEIKYEKITASA